MTFFPKVNLVKLIVSSTSSKKQDGGQKIATPRRVAAAAAAAVITVTKSTTEDILAVGGALDRDRGRDLDRDQGRDRGLDRDHGLDHPLIPEVGRRHHVRVADRIPDLGLETGPGLPRIRQGDGGGHRRNCCAFVCAWPQKTPPSRDGR